MPENPQETLAERVTRLREQMGWNKQELAAKAGLHPTHIGMIEKSDREGVRPETVKKLANAFGLSVAAMLGEAESDQVTDLEPYRPAVEAARAHGLDPDQLLQLITTMAGMFTKK